MSLRFVVEERWGALGRRAVSASDRLRVADTAVTTAAGPLVVALDEEDRRHLLVPISADRVVRGGLDGPALVLRKRSLVDGDDRRTFADLACLRRDLDDVFTGLCADVLRSVETDARDPLKVLYGRLDRWRALFQTSSQVLGRDQQAGLFAELTVLQTLLELDPSAHRTWTGPQRHHHDFSGGGRAVEVKATTISEGRRVRVHGLDQLDGPSGVLYLHWVRLEVVGESGRSLNELVDSVVNLCDDEGALRTRLAAAGYQIIDRRHYDEPKFGVAERRTYAVGPEFPRLIAGDLRDAGVPINVTDVHYTVDLSSEPPVPVSEDLVEEHLAAMLQEGSQ
ncbi:PD-(D/E)XK motif protein [Kribbella sp. NPDC020789]